MPSEASGTLAKAAALGKPLSERFFVAPVLPGGRGCRPASDGISPCYSSMWGKPRFSAKNVSKIDKISNKKN
tara:strand:- start:6 stop:221 length:216 start_codon:yes stop_codon:yes gene_type:complete